MVRHMERGNGVMSPDGTHLWLDLRHLEKEHLKTHLREIDAICRNFMGIFRNEAGLIQAVEVLNELHQRAGQPEINPASPRVSPPFW